MNAKVGMQQRLFRRKPFLRIVLQKLLEQREAFWAGRFWAGVDWVLVVVEGLVIPPLQSVAALGSGKTCRVSRHEGGELWVLGHRSQKWPSILTRHAHDFHNLLHLVALKGHRLLAIHLCLLPFEDWP